ncbi:hypothetical protein ACP70R_010884 [Stipagrostis hirtigluma subsp. patula]
MASGSGKAATASSWAAAMSAGTAEALIKDQAGDLCRWSHAARSVQHRASGGAAAGNGSGSGRSNGRALPPSSGGAAAVVARRKARQQEEELRTVMYLSNWGPNN